MSEVAQAETAQIEVLITNVYDGEEHASTTTVEVTLPPEGDDLDEWAEDQLFPHTGTGRTEGDAGYFVEIKTFAERPDLVGREFDWGI